MYGAVAFILIPMRDTDNTDIVNSTGDLLFLFYICWLGLCLLATDLPHVPTTRFKVCIWPVLYIRVFLLHNMPYILPYIIRHTYYIMFPPDFHCAFAKDRKIFRSYRCNMYVTWGGEGEDGEWEQSVLDRVFRVWMPLGGVHTVLEYFIKSFSQEYHE